MQLLALRDVASSSVYQAFLGDRNCSPSQPDVGAIVTKETVLEIVGREALAEFRHFLDGRRPVYGKDEFDKRFCEQLSTGVAEYIFERGVHTLEVPVRPATQSRSGESAKIRCSSSSARRKRSNALMVA